MKTNYSFDHSTNTLIANDAFMKAASRIGTPEYKTLLQLRKDFGDINYVIDNPAKKSAKAENRITFTAMKQFISQCRDAANRRATFDRVYELSKSQPSPYHYVKKWFLDHYANYSEEPEFDKEGFVIVKTKAQLEAEKAPAANAAATPENIAPAQSEAEAKDAAAADKNAADAPGIDTGDSADEAA